MSYLKNLFGGPSKYTVDVIVNIKMEPHRKFVIKTEVMAKSRSEAKAAALNRVNEIIEVIATNVKKTK